MKKTAFLAQEEQAQIESILLQIENQTSTEIRLAIFSRSDAYPQGLLRLAIAFTLLVSITSHYYIKDYSEWCLLLLHLLFLALAFLLSHFHCIERRLISPIEKEEEVKQMAMQIFLEQKLGNEQKAQGVLLFISLLERKFEIIAGENISAKINNTEMQLMATELSRSFKRKQYFNGIKSLLESFNQKLPRENKKTENRYPETILWHGFKD